MLSNDNVSGIFWSERSTILADIVFIIFLVFSVSLNARGQVNKDRDSVRILFIGNSLTYTNNLPLLVQEEAGQIGVWVDYEMIAFPNYAIEDHWREGRVQTLIRDGNFDFVILQQGPSSQAGGRNMLIEYGKKFAELCQISGTKLCYLMVWPSLDYYRTFDDVIKNHRDAARINDAIILPVGAAWKEYFEDTENFDFYGQDGFHPSQKGSAKAAEIIVEHLFPK